MTRAKPDLSDASGPLGARMGRGWDFAGQPGMARIVAEMYDANPPVNETEHRHYRVAVAFLIGEARAMGKVSLRRVRLDRGGYDSGGAYWGLGPPLYWAGTDGGEVDLWFRASDREAAKAHVRKLHPAAWFHH